MNITKLQLFCFSPTGTSRRVGEAIAAGLQPARLVENDVTHDAATPVVIDASSVAVFVVPVYRGQVAPTALERLRDVTGQDTPAVLVVVYGNRDYEGALVQLDKFTAERGFVTVAAGTFVGEHSYSTTSMPVAAKRPDVTDLKMAEHFGMKVRDKLAVYGAGTVPPVDVAAVPRPAVSVVDKLKFVWYGLGMKIRKPPMPLSPATDAEHCSHCGLCVKVCPVGAIAAGDETHTDASRCIRCCACVKKCRWGARTFDTPFARILAACCSRPKEPKILF